jgi:hypothetical protein
LNFISTILAASFDIIIAENAKEFYSVVRCSYIGANCKKE